MSFLGNFFGCKHDMEDIEVPMSQSYYVVDVFDIMHLAEEEIKLFGEPVKGFFNIGAEYFGDQVAVPTHLINVWVKNIEEQVNDFQDDIEPLYDCFLEEMVDKFRDEKVETLTVSVCLKCKHKEQRLTEKHYEDSWNNFLKFLLDAPQRKALQEKEDERLRSLKECRQDQARKLLDELCKD